MATIQLMVTHTVAGSEVTADIGVCIQQRPWSGGGSESILVLSIGRDNVEIRPCDLDIIEELATRPAKPAIEETEK